MIIITISGQLNSSLGIGDVLYYQDNADPVLVGTVYSISHTSSSITVVDEVSSPTDGSFLLFAKDSKVNTSDVKGYYAKITMSNGDTEKANLFAVNAGVSESSK